MTTMFAIIDPEKNNVMEGVCGMYENIPAMYEQILRLTEEEGDCNKVIGHMASPGEMTVLMPAKALIQVMDAANNNPNKEDLRLIITEDKNQDFIVAFLREFISPEVEPWGDERKRFCNVLEICRDIFEEENMELFAKICNVGIGVYTSDDWC